MKSLWKSKRKKLQTRNIEVTTYEYDAQRIIVEGFFKDDRFRETRSVTGELRPSGVFHHMTIRLLINCSNLLIEDVDVDLISVPREECRDAANCLAPIKGLDLAKGFTAKVKKMAGGIKGCTHLVELIMAMAPAALQGFFVHQLQKSSAFNPDQAKMFAQSLINTCCAWREDVPFVEMSKKKLNMK